MNLNTEPFITTIKDYASELNSHDMIDIILKSRYDSQITVKKVMKFSNSMIDLCQKAYNSRTKINGKDPDQYTITKIISMIESNIEEAGYEPYDD